MPTLLLPLLVGNWLQTSDLLFHPVISECGDRIIDATWPRHALPIYPVNQQALVACSG